MKVLGIDTSNYTTSAAIIDENKNILFDKRILLPVKSGERGIRQSDGVFYHTKNLGEILSSFSYDGIKAICVSVKPRNTESSYMPVFLSGKNFAKSIAKAINGKYFETTHQEGHISSGLYKNHIPPKFISVHLSGGTTEILLCKKKGSSIITDLKGKTIDISAGQFIDRVGVSLGLQFPCGKEMDKTAYTGNLLYSGYKAWQSKGDLSFSGAESHCQRLIAKQENKEEIISNVFETISRNLYKAVLYVSNENNIKDILLVGGVSSSKFLRKRLKELNKDKLNFYYANDNLSTDNAVGTALIGLKKLKETENLS